MNATIKTIHDHFTCLSRWETDGGSVTRPFESNDKHPMNTKTTIPIHISAHHLALSPALVNRMRESIGSLSRVGSDAVRAEVVLRLRPGIGRRKLFRASARLALPGRDIHASATHANLYAAIAALENRLGRRLRKRKTNFARRIDAKRPNDGITSAARLEATISAS